MILNVDFSTSEALKIARKIDTYGDRTLAVLTKIDLMDDGTNALEMLEGRVIPVKLGIIGVLNRSQRDIKENTNIKKQLKKEADFLARHYPNIASKHGTPYLAQTLSELLMVHIRKCLPDLKKSVDERFPRVHKNLKSYGTEIPNKKSALNRIIFDFAGAYCLTVEGIMGSIAKPGLCGKTKIYSVLQEDFKATLSQIQPQPTKFQLLTALRNATGPLLSTSFEPT